MNKEVTCRLVNGKPLTVYREEYIPKKGDIIKVDYNEETWIAIYESKNEDYYNTQLLSCIQSIDKDKYPPYQLFKKGALLIKDSFVYKATPEEIEVMLYLLNENGHELANGELKDEILVTKSYMTSEEARLLAESKLSMDKLFNFIQEAAEKGRFELRSHLLPKSVIRELEKLGYTVYDYTRVDQNSSMTVISWRGC